MADAIAPAPATLVLSGSGGSGPVAVTVTSEAGNALQLVEGLLEGVALGRPAKGMLEVMTANGPIQVKAVPPATLPAIPPGARLQFQLAGGETGPLVLTAINGRPLAGGMLPPNLAGLLGQGAAAGAAKTAGALPGQPGPAATPATVPAGGGAPAPAALGLTATVIRPAQAAGSAAVGGGPAFPSPPGLPADLPAGTRLTVRIAGIQLPDPATAGAVPPNPTGPAAPPQAPSPQTHTNGPAGGGPANPALPPVPGATTPPATVLTGTVTAHPPNGNAVVQTPIATLAVPTQADLPVGTRMTLEVVGAPLPPLSAPAAAARPEGLTPQGWPALSEALDTLAAANQPQALEQLLRVIPQPDARLAASMAAFGSALRAGEAKGLLPETSLRGIEKSGKKDLAGRLKADLEALEEDSGRPVGNGDWRAYTLPMLHGGVVEPVHLFVRKAGDDDGGGRAGAGGTGNDHRFVVDLSLTRLGRLQLDGLVRREDKLFDLIIRTGKPLDAELRRDILGIFTNASELVGTKGTVSFQAGGRWIDFPPAPPAPTRIEV